MTKIYTKTGDAGETSLFGGERVAKNHPNIEAFGSVDELNAHLGLYQSKSEHPDLSGLISSIQPTLFTIGSHLATPATARKAAKILPPLEPLLVLELENAIDTLETELEPLTAFVLPGGTTASALLQVARAVCRRAERGVVELGVEDPDQAHPAALIYLNRLSDLLFVMARVENRRAGIKEPVWTPKRPKTSD